MNKHSDHKTQYSRVFGVLLLILLVYTIYSTSSDAHMRSIAHKTYKIEKISSIVKQTRAPNLYLLTGNNINGDEQFIWYIKANGKKAYDIYSVMGNEGISKNDALKKAHESLGNFKEKNISLVFNPLSFGNSKQNSMIKANVFWFIVLDSNSYGKGYILVDFFTGKAIFSSH